MRPEKSPGFIAYFLPLGLCCATLLYFLGGYGLLDNNEGLYGQIAREMLESGNYIIPHLNGVPYLEKPPLLYWLIALSFKALGVHETAARLVPVLSALGLLGLVYQILCRQLSRDVAVLACLILGTSLGYVVFSRTLLFDVLFTMCLTGALFALFEMMDSKKSQRDFARFPLFFYFFLGLAVLAKGLLALVLGGLVWGLYFAVEGHKRVSLWAPLHPWGLIIFMGITVPWHFLAAVQEDAFIWFYFVNEHLLRFLGLREPYDYYTGPFYYYAYRLPIYFFPWILVLPFLGKKVLKPFQKFAVFFQRKCENLPKTISKILQRKRRNLPETILNWSPSRSPHRSPFIIFLGCWSVVVVFFFSFSTAKANYYLVTAMPPLSILLSLLIFKTKNFRIENRIFSGGQGLLLLVSALCFLVFLSGIFPEALEKYFPFLTNIPLEVRKPLWKTGFLGLGMMGFYRLCRYWQLSLWPYLPLGSFCFLVLMGASQVVPFYEERLSQKKMAQQVVCHFKGPFYLYREYETVSSLRFYLKKPLYIVDSLSQDLLFGQQQGKTDVFRDKDTLRKRGGIIFVRKNREDEFLTYFPEAQKKEIIPNQGQLILYEIFAKP